MTEIEQQKEKKQKKKKDPEEKSTLQRSKTFVNLLFRGGRKKDASRGRSKSPGDKSGKGSVDLCRPARVAAVFKPEWNDFLLLFREANGRHAELRAARRGGGHGPQAAGRGGGRRCDEDVPPGETLCFPLQTETFPLSPTGLHCESLMYSMWRRGRWRAWCATCWSSWTAPKSCCCSGKSGIGRHNSFQSFYDNNG